MAKEDIRLSGVVMEIHERTGKALRIERVQARLDDRQGAEAEDQRP